MKKTLFIAIFSIFSVAFLSASDGGGGGGAVFTETPEEAQLREIGEILHVVNEKMEAFVDLPGRDSGVVNGLVRKEMKKSVKQSLHVFYDACKNLFPFLSDETRERQFRALVRVARRYITDVSSAELSQAHDYSKKIYDCVSKLLPCLKAFEDREKRTLSKDCLEELNHLILGLDTVVISPFHDDEETPVPFMEIISPIKKQINKRDFSPECAANLLSTFDRWFAGSGIEEANKLDSVKVNLGLQFDIVDGGNKTPQKERQEGSRDSTPASATYEEDKRNGEAYYNAKREEALRENSIRRLQREEIEELSKRLEDTQEKLQQKVEALEQLQAQYSRLSENLRRAEQARGMLFEEEKRNKEAISSQDKAIAMKTAEVQSLQIQMVAIQQNKNDIQEQLNIATLELGRMRGNLGEMKSDLERLKATSQEQASDIEERSIKVIKLQTAINTIQQNKNDIQKQLKIVTAELDAVRKKLQESESQSQQAEKQFEKLQDQSNEWQSELRLEEKYIVEQHDELDKMRATVEEQHDELDKMRATVAKFKRRELWWKRGAALAALAVTSYFVVKKMAPALSSTLQKAGSGIGSAIGSFFYRSSRLVKGAVEAIG